jgi:hypothetical protein
VPIHEGDGQIFEHLAVHFGDQSLAAVDLVPRGGQQPGATHGGAGINVRTSKKLAHRQLVHRRLYLASCFPRAPLGVQLLVERVGEVVVPIHLEQFAEEERGITEELIGGRRVSSIVEQRDRPVLAFPPGLEIAQCLQLRFGESQGSLPLSPSFALGR